MHRLHSPLPFPCILHVALSPITAQRLLPSSSHCLCTINKTRQQRLGRKISFIFPQSNVARENQSPTSLGADKRHSRVYFKNSSVSTLPAEYIYDQGAGNRPLGNPTSESDYKMLRITSPIERHTRPRSSSLPPDVWGRRSFSGDFVEPLEGTLQPGASQVAPRLRSVAFVSKESYAVRLTIVQMYSQS